MKPFGRIEHHKLCEWKQFFVKKIIYDHNGANYNWNIHSMFISFGYGGTILLLLVYKDPDGIKIDSVGTNSRKWRAVSSNVVFLTWFRENNEMTLRRISYRVVHVLFLQVHAQIHGTESRFRRVWACTRFEAHDAVSKQDRFSYDYAISSYISTPSIIFHSQIH